MSAIRMDGKMVSAKVRGSILEEVNRLKEQGVRPGLAVIIVGEDPASKVYVRNKERACEECGFYSEKYALPEETTQEQLLELIEQLNQNPMIDGILCQLPVPKHIDEQAIIDAISPEKDVDAFHPVNVGKIMVGNFDFLPCTPAGVMQLLEEYGIDPKGKDCVVIGRSNIVGKPMAMLLLHKHGTVTICHSRTQNLKEVCAKADILVAAVGRADFVTADMVKEGAVVIDVGMNRKDGKLCGDVCFDEVNEKAAYLTPVPGGVGPMTITMLMKNTLKAAKLHHGIVDGKESV
ncbi:MAG: bifunctional methylenetetrahydrofolate dehydrogenase/methenyltetrahydrofolate cyclohydrolase FolD [Eubacteriales bacterium]|nr:bifunctional methylenetetrahydrofolate dehydrogenase/methenyltetrahydrofolate cyclohydrolase FolD [Eubacteriales bacterium]